MFMISSRCCRLRARCCSRVTLVSATGWQHACCQGGAACRELAARCELSRSACINCGRTRAAMIAMLCGDVCRSLTDISKGFYCRQVLRIQCMQSGQLSRHLNPCASDRLSVIHACLNSACAHAGSRTAAQTSTVCQVSACSSRSRCQRAVRADLDHEAARTTSSAHDGGGRWRGYAPGSSQQRRLSCCSPT